MKKINYISAALVVAGCLVGFVADAQDAPRPKQEQPKSTSSDDAPRLTTEGLHKEHEARKDPTAQKALDEVERASKAVNESSDAFLVMYTLAATKEEMSENIATFGKEFKDDMPKAAAIRVLSNLIDKCSAAKKEADDAASSKINYSEKDKQTIKNYQELYAGILSKLDVVLKEKQK